VGSRPVPEPGDFQLHECRHSYKSWLEDIGLPDSRIDRYVGHSDGSVQRRSSHQLDHQSLEDALAITAYLRRAASQTRGDWMRDSRATVRDTA
jgi:integrase